MGLKRIQCVSDVMAQWGEFSCLQAGFVQAQKWMLPSPWSPHSWSCMMGLMGIELLSLSSWFHCHLHYNPANILTYSERSRCFHLPLLYYTHCFLCLKLLPRSQSALFHEVKVLILWEAFSGMLSLFHLKNGILSREFYWEAKTRYFKKIAYK